MIIVKEIIRTYYTCGESVKLDIDTAIENLSKSGDLDETERIVIYFTREEYTLIDIADITGIPSSTVGFVLDKACGKIADYLGKEYQDDKVLEMVEHRLGRPLTKEEAKFCLFKMRNFRNDGAARVNLFNFEDKDGKFVERESDQAEGQVDV